MTMPLLISRLRQSSGELSSHTSGMRTSQMYSATGRTSTEAPKVAPATASRIQLRSRTARNNTSVPVTRRNVNRVSGWM